MIRFLTCEKHAPVVHCYRKGALFLFKRVCFTASSIILAVLLSCTSFKEEILDDPDTTYDPNGLEEDVPAGKVFTLFSADGRPREELFYEVCVSEHAIAYVAAHAVSETTAKELLDRFENRIYPKLPLEEGQKILVLLTHMESQIYGYSLLSEPGQTVCLNALYPEDLLYVLAHEYQHLCAHAACEAGGTTLSEEMDELLSDLFCETLFPGWGRERGILSEQRSENVYEKMNAWKKDSVSYAHRLLREGYTEEEMKLLMENR